MTRRTRPIPGRLHSPAAEVWGRRLAHVARVLGREELDLPARPSHAHLVEALERTIDVTDRAEVWLALAALSGVLPRDEEVVGTTRRGALDGAGALWRQVEAMSMPSTLAQEVTVLTEVTLADVNHTVATDLATGIQRVARLTVQRWLRDSDIVPVAWTVDFAALRTLTVAEHGRLLDDGDQPTRGPAGVVVPWRSRILVPELAAEHGRSHRLLALARWSGCSTGVIGFDCVPFTSAETTAEGFAAVFYGNLAAVRHFDRVAAISDAAAVEYEGWRRMLGAVGMTGPQIAAVPLPEEAPKPDDDALDDAARRFCIPGLPLVLVVGSHEPRKNHLAVLHAAEQAWRSGEQFSLTFVGGNSWASEAFAAELAELQSAGRPVESVSRLPDRLLWAAYRLARFTVFPSLNEGFGLPVAESLAAATPVLTSNYGSMAEIGAAGGTYLVDPRDDDAVAAAFGELLRDDELVRRLQDEALERPSRTWDTYASELWEFLTSPRTEENTE
ncbi:MAG: glycosyltransferase family 4 protein [Cellulomonadaceae bacterium]|nr:glycosyltransferase family 4 protein [Cellulomonadaceae bacterium]